jgi:hypothetical protein
LGTSQTLTNKTLSTGCVFPTLNQDTTGSAGNAGKATNLVGGNATTLLGSIPYQSNTDTTTLLAPNTTATKKFLRMTGTGTNGAAPAWDTITASDLPATYLTAESDTLSSVTGRGATTSTRITLTGDLRMQSHIGLDAGKTIYFGYEEGFGGTDTGGTDYGYITYDNNSSTYGAGGGETSVLRVGVQNDGAGTVSDSIAIEATADIYLRPSLSGGGGEVYVGTYASKSKVLNASNYSANITSLGSLTNISTGSSTTAGTITGAWTLTGTFQATYADLAENYEADAAYEPGTVVELGGEKEVTLAEDSTCRVAGVVSTNPAYLLNKECSGKHVVAIALQGRVPVKVRGRIRKGDFLVSGGNGFARPSATPVYGSVIGKAIENFDGIEGVIEVMIGRT